MALESGGVEGVGVGHAGKLPQTRGIGYLLPQGDDVLRYGAVNTESF